MELFGGLEQRLRRRGHDEGGFEKNNVSSVSSPKECSNDCYARKKMKVIKES